MPSRVKCQMRYCGLIARSVARLRILQQLRSSAASLRAPFPARNSVLSKMRRISRVSSSPEIMAERMMDFFREVKIV